MVSRSDFVLHDYQEVPFYREERNRSDALSVLQAEPDYDLINNFYARMLLKKILKKEASERIQASEILDSEF